MCLKDGYKNFYETMAQGRIIKKEIERTRLLRLGHCVLNSDFHRQRARGISAQRTDLLRINSGLEDQPISAAIRSARLKSRSA